MWSSSPLEGLGEDGSHTLNTQTDGSPAPAERQAEIHRTKCRHHRLLTGRRKGASDVSVEGKK